MAAALKKKMHRASSGAPAKRVELAREAVVQHHLQMAGAIIDIVSVRVPSTMDSLRAAGIHVSREAQGQTCRAVFLSLCSDIDFCLELATDRESPPPETISGYIDRHLHGIVGRALRPSFVREEAPIE
jgi:hypothetical protein